jgi:hypothetical protein
MPAPHSTLHGTVVWCVVSCASSLSHLSWDHCRSSIQEHGQRGNHQCHPGVHRGAEGQPSAGQDQRSSRHEPAKLERDRIASRRALPPCLFGRFVVAHCWALTSSRCGGGGGCWGNHKQLSRKAHARAPSEGSFLFGSNQKVITDYKSDEDDDDDSDDDGTWHHFHLILILSIYVGPRGVTYIYIICIYIYIHIFTYVFPTTTR